MRRPPQLLGILLLLAWALSPSGAPATPGASGEPAFHAAIEADWLAQESRLERAPEDPTTLDALLDRADRLLARLRHLPDVPSLDADAAALARLREAVNLATTDPAPQRRALYLDIRGAARNLVLKNPRVTGKPIVFLKRRRFVCQMLHEYLGYFYDYGNVTGGTVALLEDPGRSDRVRDLIHGRLPPGNYTTLALDYDARTVYFAFAPRAASPPGFYSTERRCFHLFALDLEDGALRQLTDGLEDDFDPCPLPDGGLAFMSTRRGGFGRCHNPWEPLPTYTLHRIGKDGTGLRTLSFHETNEWHPFVLNDGRIVYTRWDYVDRSAANYHGLWVSNPDGTNPSSLFGSYTTAINALYQPHAIPGSSRILFVAGAHHADVGGSLVIVDPAQTRLDPGTGEDTLQALDRLTPEVCFPEAPGWPKSWFHSPWPLSEDFFLVAFSFDPLPGMGPGEKRDTRTGLYYYDRFGNLELLHRDADVSCMYPLPLAPRPRPPSLASTLDPALGDDGEFVLTDVRQSLFPLPPDRPVRELRIFQVLPKSESHVANQPRLGYANAESARLLLGTVPVETDGSAHFRAPARKPLYFQAVDASGRAVQGMRSLTYLQPGERRSCIGCHEPPGTAVSHGNPLALRRPSSQIQPGPEAARPLSFPRLVQPILDRHCVRCHDGSSGPGQSPLNLTGAPAPPFTMAYQSLRPFVRWYEWGGESIAQTATRPGRLGADASRLPQVLGDATHQPALTLSDDETRRLYLWLDANAPFYGTYSRPEQLAQHEGKAVAVPQLQ